MSQQDLPSVSDETIIADAESVYARLDEPHQRILRLLFNEGGSAEKVARITGLTPTEVLRIQKEALAKLHESD